MMMTLCKKYALNSGFFALAALMLATRIHHFGSAIALPDASLAIFFIAGLYLKRWHYFVLLLIEAAMVDYLAISQFQVSDWCISPAYIGLIPTYAALWLAGIYSAKYSQNQVKTYLIQLSLLWLGTSVAFVISNGTFYLFSGRYAEMAVSLYSENVAQYYLPYLSASLIYGVLIVAIVQIKRFASDNYLVQLSK